MIRSSILLIFIMMILVDGSSYARSTSRTYGRSFHKYNTGVVQASSSAGIVFNNRQYTYAPTVKIRAHVKNTQDGSFKEIKAELYDIRVGSNVIIKVEGTTIYEIIIERWKQ